MARMGGQQSRWQYRNKPGFYHDRDVFQRIESELMARISIDHRPSRLIREVMEALPETRVVIWYEGCEWRETL